MKNIAELKTKLPPTIELFPDHAILIDQRYLPRKVVFEKIHKLEQAVRAIKEMHIRGAQAIAGAGLAGMVVAAAAASGSREQIYLQLENAAKELIAARPTAVNISWGVRKILAAAAAATDVPATVFANAQEIFASEISNNIKLGDLGADLIKPGMKIQTHCNAGSLSSLWYGTATAPLFSAWRQGKDFSVFVDETRPRLQGARLTAWELKQVEIDYTVVCDNTCGSLLSRGEVDMVIVGADRIAANGDVANKIGTYPLALMAHEHNIPFYVAAVEATIDLAMPRGSDIPIESRSQAEFWDYLSPRAVDPTMPARNLAFDVTPAKYVTKIITEQGIKSPAEILSK
jgi:methylthioribose-1-phosphate isomerase